MNNEQAVTLNLPSELKRRLEQVAKDQGVSLSERINYLLTIQLVHIESDSSLQTRLSKRNPVELKKKVLELLEQVPDRAVPSWDDISHI